MKNKIALLMLTAIILFLTSCRNKGSFLTTITSETTTSPTTTLEPTTTKETIDGRYVLEKEDVNSFTQEYMNLYGRTYMSDRNLVLDHNATGFEVWFYGTELTSEIVAGGTALSLKVFIDDDTEGIQVKVIRNRKYTLVKGLEEGVHKAKIVKTISTFGGKLTMSNLSTDGKFLSKTDSSEKLNIEFVGDSISCGAGVITTSANENSFMNSDVTKGYAYLTSEMLDANPSIVSCCGICVKGKVTLNQNMIEMYPRLSFNSAGSYDFKKEMDIVVLELGTNDSWYMSSNANYSKNDFKDDYLELLQLIRKNNVKAKIVCVYGLMEVNKSIEESIKNAISDMNDENISYLLLPQDNSGGSSHPGIDGALKQAQALAEYIGGIN